MEGVRRYQLDDDWEILVGKTAKDNDMLSIGIAAPADFWFHVAGMPGSHVVARHPSRPEQCPREIKRLSAGLAAFFSRGRNARKVAVHWTCCRHVSKKKRAPTGQVQLKKYRTIMAEPINPKEVFGGSPCP